MSQGGKIVDRVNGAHVPELAKKTAAHSQMLTPFPSLQETSLPPPQKEVRHISVNLSFLCYKG